MKENENDLGKKNFLAMSMKTTDMLEDPNQFFKDMAAMTAAIEKSEKNNK